MIDVLGNALDYSGRAPRNAKLVDSHCGTFDGVDDYLSVPSLVGTETVVSSGGTSTPTVSAGRIDFTAGTCWNLLLSDGSHWPMAEGAGTIIHDVSGNDNHGTATGINEATFWGTGQDVYHYNIAEGFSRYTHATLGDILVPYGADGQPLTITPPSGYTKDSDNPPRIGHNKAETKVDLTGGVAAPGTAGVPTDWYYDSANPTFHRDRTKDGAVVAADRLVQFEESLSDPALSQANIYTRTRAV